jgi:hypothetical protein
MNYLKLNNKTYIFLLQFCFKWSRILQIERCRSFVIPTILLIHLESNI